MDQQRSWKLIFAAVIMGVTGITLFITAIWALTYNGSLSANLRGFLHGHSLTTYGIVFLVVGIALIVLAGGVLEGSRVSRWLGIGLGAIGAISGIWFVAYYPGWAIAYTVLGVVIVYPLTLYESELGSS